MVIAAVIGDVLCTTIFHNCNKSEALVYLKCIMNTNSVVISDNVAKKIINQLQYNVKHNFKGTKYFMDSDCDTCYCSLTGTKLNIFMKEEDDHAKEDTDSM